ncbi:hypothetical protein RNZ50_03370 [Paracoccaceae bacterium Fryx2]|nr:hypothetical protein [Paracoccaceae bacterium Fryx2]
MTDGKPMVADPAAGRARSGPAGPDGRSLRAATATPGCGPVRLEDLISRANAAL